MPHLALNYINRGDPDVHDFTKEDFIIDNAWHDLDLSNIIPEGARLIHLRIKCLTSDIAKSMGFRKNGNVNGINSATLRTGTANLYTHEDLWVNCDSNRIMEYYIQPSAWIVIYVTIRGWFTK